MFTAMRPSEITELRYLDDHTRMGKDRDCEHFHPKYTSDIVYIKFGIQTIFLMQPAKISRTQQTEKILNSHVIVIYHIPGLDLKFAEGQLHLLYFSSIK